MYPPAGNIRIGNVEWDSSYAHVVDFQSVEEQTAYFAARLATWLREDAYTYVRADSVLRVEGIADDYYHVNYVAYQNNTLDNKWYYAFVTDVIYVNNNCTVLQLQEDAWQTWQFDLHFAQCFVEREHALSDKIGEHLNPEPDIPVMQIYQNRYSDGDLGGQVSILIESNAYPCYRGDGDFVQGVVNYVTGGFGTETVKGNYYQGTYHGCRIYAFDWNAPSHTPTETQDYYGNADDFLAGINAAGGGESVTAVYCFPKAFLPDSTKHDGLYPHTDPIKRKHVFEIPTELDGYKPHNNKIFTYPYTFVRFDDNNGHTADYRLEWWEPTENVEDIESGEVKTGLCYDVTTAVDAAASIFVVPQNYNGIENNVTEAYSFPYSVPCSFPYSSYQNWLAANLVPTMVNIGIDVATVAVPAAKGFKALSSATKTQRAANKIAGAQHAKNAASASRSLRSQAAAQRAIADRNLGNAAGILAFSGQSALHEAESIISQSYTPNVARSSSSGNNLFAEGWLTYNRAIVAPRREFAQIIDDFFTRYGYAVDRVKTPNYKGRKYFNYIKTQGAQVFGEVPEDARLTIAEIFDDGVTVWHDATRIGTYTGNDLEG